MTRWDRCSAVRTVKGFMLVEVVVAMALLAGGTLALMALLRLASNEARDADLRERLLWRVTEVADSIGGRSDVGGGRDSIPGGGVVRWGRAGGATWVTGFLPGADSAWVRVPVRSEPTAAIVAGPE